MALFVPLVALAVATAGLALLVEPFLGFYYQWAWWSYIFAVDALNQRLSGRSLIRDDPRGFLRLCFVSVVFWTAFEALNLRLGNWYYVMDHESRAVRWAGGFVAFATVLPGIALTEAVLANRGWLRHVRVAALRWSRKKELSCLGAGLVCLVLPLLWPDVFFPLVWGSVVFLVEPWNRRHAARSFLRELESGEAGPFLRTLVAGLVCGVLWETWNAWARSKWIYTVPGASGLKVFEMPLLGFFGFPPFAVECLAVVSFVEARWPAGERSATAGAKARRAAAYALATAATLAVFAAADSRTVDSIYVPVERLEVVPPAHREALTAAGLRSPELLLRALGDEEELPDWSARTGLREGELRTDRERVALVMHRGLGQERARALAGLGIRTRADLSRWTPERLAAGLRTAGARGPDRFLERRARVWLEGLEPKATSRAGP
jgi:Domain of unknown function (DUF4332)